MTGRRRKPLNVDAENDRLVEQVDEFHRFVRPGHPVMVLISDEKRSFQARNKSFDFALACLADDGCPNADVSSLAPSYSEDDAAFPYVGLNREVEYLPKLDVFEAVKYGFNQFQHKTALFRERYYSRHRWVCRPRPNNGWVRSSQKGWYEFRKSSDPYWQQPF